MRKYNINHQLRNFQFDFLYLQAIKRLIVKVVIQRVTSASVKLEGVVRSEIGSGLLIYAGFEETDNDDDIDWLCKKILQLRIFSDRSGVMNLSVTDVGGEILVVSQFTLHARTRKGNRPSYIRAARPEIAVPLYNNFVDRLSGLLGREIGTGEFGSSMQVESVNDGPVTILIDTKDKE
jgi:D-aminoacyl-tRNA deacylase